MVEGLVSFVVFMIICFSIRDATSFFENVLREKGFASRGAHTCRLRPAFFPRLLEWSGGVAIEDADRAASFQGKPAAALPVIAPLSEDSGRGFNFYPATAA